MPVSTSVKMGRRKKSAKDMTPPGCSLDIGDTPGPRGFTLKLAREIIYTT
jgi:hypothetical protein